MRKFLVFIALSAILFGLTGCYSTEESNVPIILDATSYIRGESTIGEDELIEVKGEPDKIEEWNYEIEDRSYPIRTLYYGNYAFHFNNGILHRISISDEIPYSNKSDILKMFGLKKYSNTVIKDLNASYRASMCGVYDFWIPIMDEDSLNEIRISYSSIFEGNR